MKNGFQKNKSGCGCDSGCDRRDFLSAMSVTAGSMAFKTVNTTTAGSIKNPGPIAKKKGALVRAVFLYPPSKEFADNSDGWWSWPGNDFDAETRQKKYMKALSRIEKKLDMNEVKNKLKAHLIELFEMDII